MADISRSVKTPPRERKVVRKSASFTIKPSDSGKTFYLTSTTATVATLPKITKANDGMIVSVVLGALASLITLMRPDVLQGMQGFLLGSTSFIGWNACVLMLGVLLVCVVLAFALSRVLDALSLGESTALSLGLPLAPVRVALVCVLALATGTAVAQTGLVAFVGLAAPHLVRSLVKTKHNWIVLLSTLMGGALLLAADLLARMLLSPQEMPVGVLTAVLGGGYLLWLMYRSQTARAAR